MIFLPSFLCFCSCFLICYYWLLWLSFLCSICCLCCLYLNLFLCLYLLLLLFYFFILLAFWFCFTSPNENMFQNIIHNIVLFICSCGRYFLVFIIVSKLVIVDLCLYSLKALMKERHHRRRYGVISV